MNVSKQILKNAIENIETAIEMSKEELELTDVIDQQDLMFVFDVNIEIVRNNFKLKVLKEMMNELFKTT